MSNRLAPFTPNTSRAFRLEVICVGEGYVKYDGVWYSVPSLAYIGIKDWWDRSTWSDQADYQLSYDECFAADMEAEDRAAEAEELYGEFVSRMIEQGWKFDGWKDCPHHGIVRTDVDGNCPYCIDEEEIFEPLPATMGTEYVYSDDEIPF